MDQAEEDVLAFMDFPPAHRVKLHSTNPIERLNGEIKRRTKVVGTFPNEQAIIRLVGAILIEQNDEWAVQRGRYKTLETIVPLSDNAMVRMAVTPARQSGPTLPETVFEHRFLHHAKGHNQTGMHLLDEPTAGLDLAANLTNQTSPPAMFANAIVSVPAAGPRRSGGQSSARKTSSGALLEWKLIVTVLLSLGLHLAAVTAVLLLPRAKILVVNGSDKPTEVELVMEEHKGDAGPSATRPPAPQTSLRTKAKQSREDKPRTADPPRPDTVSVPVQPPVEPETESEPTKPTVETAKASDPVRAPVQTENQQAALATTPVPPSVQTAPTITLSGTDSPSDARAWGARIIPAAPDAVFHNRPPEYPSEAVLNGQHGTVVVVIHVSPAGTAAGVDVVSSSGYVLLDRAARDAVTRWRFLPAVKDGQPVASDMTMGFVFDN